MTDQIPVKIQHVEGPCSFLIKYESETFKKQIRAIQKEIAKHVSSQKPQTPAIGSVMAFFHLQWTSFVRVKITSAEVTGFRFLLIDYGYYMFSADRSLFYDIPDNLKGESEIVKRASLVLKPKVGKYWSEASMKLMKSFDAPNDSRVYYFETYGTHRDGTLMGDIIVKSTYDPAFSVSEMLIQQNLAVREDNEFKPPEKKPQPTLPDKPVANFETIFAMFRSDYKENKRELLSARAPIEVVSPMQIENKVQTKRVSDQTAKRRSPPVTRKEEIQKISQDTNYSLNMFLFGQHLKQPFKSIQQVPFKYEIKEGIKSLSKIQESSWAQIYDGQSMLIVGDKTKHDHLDYLLPIVHLIQTSRGDEVKGLGPVAVIVAKSKIICASILKALQTTKGMTIVSVLDAASKLVDLLNGCDILVTTPIGFARIINEAKSLKIFEKERIKHLVLDGCDSMMESFNSEINLVIRTCTNGKDKPESNPQIVITADTWLKAMESNFMVLTDPKKSVICIDNFIEAAASVCCKFSIAYSTTDLNEKVKDLITSLNSSKYKKCRTLVVASEESLKSVFKMLGAEVDVMKLEDNNEETKQSWLLQKSGEFSVLVTTDSVLSKMELRNVQNLIHFDVPTWRSFVARFGVLMEEIYKSRNLKEGSQSISTRIYLEDENLDQFVEIINFVQKRKLSKVSTAALNFVEKIKQNKEQDKCMNLVKICSNVLQFGECLKDRCSDRHILCESDKPLIQLPSNASIKFELVSINNPSSYVIKVLSYFEDNQWNSLDAQNSEIEILDEHLQVFCSNLDESKAPHEINLAEVYAVQHGGKWNRCKVIVNNYTSVNVFLIDYGVSRSTTVNKLRVLPEKFKIRPLVYSLQIMNVIPLDREEVWDPEAKKNIKQLIEGLEDCSFTCKVGFVLQDIIFADSFDAINTECGSLKLRLNLNLKTQNICDFDEEVGKKLRKLADDGQLIKLSEEVKSNPEPSHTSTEEKPKESKKVTAKWKELPCDDYYDIYVKHFKNPESFFVVPELKGKKFLQESLHQIESSKVTHPLQNFEIGMICAMKDKDKIRRTKIIEESGNSFEVLLLDHGEILNCDQSALYELPQALIEKLAFQVVHCRMMGIRPKFNMKTWPPLQSKSINQLIKCYKSPLKMFVMKKNQKEDNLTQLGMNSYDIILIDPVKGKHLDTEAVSKKIADLDKITKPIEESSTIDESSNISFEEKNSSDLAVLAKMIDLINNGDNFDEGFEDKDSNAQTLSPKAIERIVEPSVEIKPTNLNYIYKQPKIEWCQNDSMVKLQISSIDCKNYALKLKDSSVDVAIEYEDRPTEYTSIKLYSSINVNLSSHELCGLNIIVRMSKLHYDDWPRLTANAERSQFIKFNSRENKEPTVSIPKKLNYRIPAPPELDSSDSSDNERSLQLSDDDID